MRRLVKHACMPILVGILTYLTVNDGVAQIAGTVATGTPAFGSFGGSPFDTVNLGNLNVHLTIPVLHKAGRGIPFSYDLSYDTSIWTTVTSNGITQWQPVDYWGWRAVTEVVSGWVSWSFTQTDCPPSGREKGGTESIWSNWIYHDRFGVAHHFPGVAVVTTNSCGTSAGGMNAIATDGSGYTLTTSTGDANLTVTTRGGGIINPPGSVGTGAAKVADSNGNQLTAVSGTQFFDTLSSTTPVLSVSGTGTPTSPFQFAYTSPSDANVLYSMNYTAYTVATNFGWTSPAIAEYPPTVVPLVSSIQLPDGSGYTFTYEATSGSCTPLTGTTAPCVTGRIESVKLPTGGTISYAFGGGANGNNYINTDGTTATLTRVLLATTGAPAQSWLYGRASLGARLFSTTVTDPNNNQTVIDFSEDGNTTTPTYNFYETQRTISQLISGTQTLLATDIKCYNGNYTGCSTAQVSSPITETDAYSKPAPSNSTRLSEVLYNNYGLVTDDREYDYGATTGSAPGTAKLIQETATSYASLGNGILSRPASVIIYDWTSGSGKTIASTTYTYDQGTPTATSGTPQHVAITGSRGNATTTVTSTSSTTSLSASSSYYDTGMPNVSTDVNGAQTTYVYSSASNPYNSSLTASCGNSFATTIQEPVNLSRSVQWNCIGGVSQQVIDENQQVVKMDYSDPNFWRPADLYDQESNETTIHYVGQTAVEVAQSFNGGLSVSASRTTLDGFGRTIFSQRLRAPSATYYDTAEIDYNNLSQVYRSTMPYTALGSPSSSNTTVPATKTVYDALDRPTQTTDGGGGTISYTYTGNDVLQVVSPAPSSENNKKKQFEYDGLGRLTSVCELTAGTSAWPGGSCAQTNPTTGYWTKYTYDALGDLTGVTQNAQGTAQSRSYTYDYLSRLISETNPENGVYPAQNGTTSYTYDSASTCGVYAGDLVKRVDSVGNVTCYTYDGMHRNVQISYPIGSYSAITPTKHFVYDSATVDGQSMGYAKARLAEAYTGSSTSKVTDIGFTYSPRGEVTSTWESTPNSGGFYQPTAAYWANGEIQNLWISELPSISYTTDGEGRVSAVSATSGENPVTAVTYVAAGTTEPIGALTQVNFGSGDSDAFRFDPQTFRMTT